MNFGQIWAIVSSQIMKNNLAIWSHCWRPITATTLGWEWVQKVCSLAVLENKLQIFNFPGSRFTCKDKVVCTLVVTVLVAMGMLVALVCVFSFLYWRQKVILTKGQFPASFSLFSSFQHAVNNLYKIWPGLKLTSIGAMFYSTNSPKSLRNSRRHFSRRVSPFRWTSFSRVKANRVN